MSRIVYTITLSLALIFAALPAYAADKQFQNPQEEIVYRTNLGRSADVKLLIKQGVSPDQVDKAGVPLLALAASRKDEEGINVLRSLIDAGADINAKDVEGQTALFYAIRKGNIEIIDILLDRGINYYATDNTGQIARTLAFNIGRQDIVDRLDAFVKAQTEKVNKEYEEYGRQIEEHTKKIEEEYRKAQEEAVRQAEEIAKQQAEQAEVIQAQPETPTASDEYLADLAPPDTRVLAEKLESQDYQDDMRMLSFQSCAFQYWSFCRAIKQTTDLTTDELRIAIDTHRQQIIELIKHHRNEYQREQEYLETVSNNAKQRINDILDTMPSKTYRFEHKVCHMPDLQTRCTEIAETWTQEPPPRPEIEDTSRYQRGSSRSGRGSR